MRESKESLEYTEGSILLLRAWSKDEENLLSKDMMMTGLFLFLETQMGLGLGGVQRDGFSD
jgi:hypothetical protein